jgi:hypothetical protein
MAKLKSIPEGDGNLLDHCCLIFVHEHAEANIHKNNGLAMIVAGHAAGHAGRMVTGTHSRMTGTVGDLYLTLADDILDAGLGSLPTATKRAAGIVG